VPVTAPIPLFMLRDVAFETVQDKVLFWPLEIDVGFAVNDAIVGAEASVVACTAVDCAEVLPAASKAETVYE
jgi:hypothetical protein